MTDIDASLNIEMIGQGPPLVLMHGWGMHSGLFNSLIDKMKDKFRFYGVDLPGHGNSHASVDLSELDQVVHLVVETLRRLTQENINLLAWSMGGLIAQRMAMLYPELIAKIVMVSSTACFENKADWSYGLEAKILRMFSRELEKNYASTLDRFLALQFMGSEQQKKNLRGARALLATKPVPNIAAMQQGLQLLAKVDLRNHLIEIKSPCLILGGERDSLVPTAALRFITERLPKARCHIFKGSAHAPFLSHTEVFNSSLESFLL